MIKATIDANIILRLLTNDVPSQSKLVEKRLKQVNNKKLKLYLLPVTIVEVLYQLVNWYKLSRKESALMTINFILESGVVTKDEKAVIKSLYSYAETKISFVDIYLYEKAKEEKLKVLSFDKDFDKLDLKVRLRP